jgi:hypothetical protein
LHWIRVLLRIGWVQKHWVFPPLLAIDDAPIVSRLLQPACLRASAIRMMNLRSTASGFRAPSAASQIAAFDVVARRCFSNTGREPPLSHACQSLANPLPLTHNLQINGFGGIMFAVRSRNRQFALMLVTALAVSMWPAASEAYTPEQQQACSDDAFRLCSADIPDVDRVTACMITPGCRVYFKSSEAEPAVRAGMPLSLSPAAERKRKP